MSNDRFTDEQFRLSHFEVEVDVVCPKCSKRAKAKRNEEEKRVDLYCSHCGFNDRATMEVSFGKTVGTLKMSAASYFPVELWYIAEFKNDLVWAYNLEHLSYLERYIGAKLREHKDRTHFTLLEKLPRFYHEAKNRESLLKLIQRLKDK